MAQKLIIIDANSVIHRAFHALPLLATKKGQIVNAVYGFLLVLFRAIKDFQPDYIAAAFDLPLPTFRHLKFKEYKAKRPPTPDNLVRQIPKVKEMLNTLNVPVFEKEGYEADDIIATISQKSDAKIIILSGDQDSLQLVGPKIKIYFLRKGVKNTILYDEDLVKEKYRGLTPAQIIDFKALRGDPSDNIPGVRGIGEKTASDLILQFGGLENLYQKIEDNSAEAKKISERIKELLRQHKKDAFLSKELVALEKNVPLEFNLEKCRWQNYSKEEAKKLLAKFEFYSLIPRLPGAKEEKPPENKKLTLF